MRRTRGITLPELLVAAFLFVIVMGVMAGGIQWTLRGHEHGRRVREGQEKCRQALDRIVAELRTAAVLPSLGPGQRPVPSGVLWPDSYGTEAGGYQSLELTQKEGEPVHLARNLLIFTKPGTAVGAATFNPVNLGSYVYVVYEVPQARQNVLLRKVYQVSQGGGSPLGHQYTGSTWTVIPSYFAASTGLITTTEEDQVVIRLPGSADRIRFEVYHPQYVSSVTGAVGVEAGYGTSYDRQLFTVELTVGMARNDDPAKVTELHLEGQARVQSGQ